MNVMTEQDISLENMTMFCIHAPDLLLEKKRFREEFEALFPEDVSED